MTIIAKLGLMSNGGSGYLSIPPRALPTCYTIPMKLTFPTRGIEVKRAFVVSQYIRCKGNKKKRYVPLFSKKDFAEKLKNAKAYARKLSNAQLDRVIAKEWPPRRDAYNKVKWHIGVVNSDEVAVWKRAGNLPAAWTNGPLSETARKVSIAMKRNSKLLRGGAKRSVPRILQTSLDATQNDKYLLPIILPASTIPNCRRGMKKFKGDIDDGCMRSIALAISGKKKIKAYIGTKR